MTVPAVAQISHLVPMRLQVAKQRGPDQNAIGVVVRLILTITVVDDAYL